MLADKMLIKAVGAHMSGLPLNGQLTELGGRFVEARQTAVAIVFTPFTGARRRVWD